MGRTPDQCRFRQLLPGTNGNETFCCTLAQQIVGAGEKAVYRVGRDACEACCTRPLPSAAAMNPVVASFAYLAAAALVRDPGTSWREREEAVRAQKLVADKLELVRRGQFGQGKPPNGRSAASLSGEAGGPSTRLAWAVGMLTAPRRKPTVDRALASLRLAGFDSIHIFAEPDSWIPDEFRHLPVTYHGRRLGNLGNFYTSLATLFMLEPAADCYAIFQDDIVAAQGLKAWCDTQFWPDDGGIVSLYTCGVYHADAPGWRLLMPGLHRTFGALAFAFRRDALKDFLTDGRLLGFRERGYVAGDDGVVGEWATRRGIGIAYHTPSLVGHTGSVSSIGLNSQGIAGPLTTTQAVLSVSDIRKWKAPARTLGRIGLIGWNTATGLGYLNRDVATHFPIAKWLVPDHPKYPALSDPRTDCPLDHVPLGIGVEHQKRWLRGLDWILFAEVPYVGLFAQRAREVGVRVACIPMWELTDLQVDWVHLVDLMICPTGYTFEVLSDWKRRFGFTWDVVHVPWPVDARRFQFRRRGKCKKFLFVNGTGGCLATRSDGSMTPYRRKGMDLVLEAARLLAPVPFIVYSQVGLPPPVPKNVELRTPPQQNERLYDDGDVCVQPSHWEGLGLQMLECQAAGLPLVTTDAPPMNELNPLRTVRVAATEIVSVLGSHVFTSHRLSAEDLASTLESLYQTDVSRASQEARQFVEREHSWDTARRILQDVVVR